MRKMRSAKRIASLVAALCLMLSMSITVYASSTDASPQVAKAREGVLQINLLFEDRDGNQYVQHGSGFLIGASTGATTVITNYHVVKLDAEEKALYGFTNEKIQVVVKRDVVIEASYVNGSEKTDFAILELSQAIYDRSPLKLADSDDVVETQNIYALGFPWVTSEVQDDQVYTSSDVTITNGIVGKFQSIDDIKFILHNASLGFGNSGGPLVNSNGDVIGVNAMFAKDEQEAGGYYYSIAINEIAEVLDALGIVYEEASGNSAPVISETTETTPEPIPAPVPEPTPTPEPESETQKNGNTVIDDNDNNGGSTPVIVPEPTPAKDNTMLIVGVVAVVAVIGIVVVVVLSKKKTPPTPPISDNTRPPIPPYPPTPPNMDSGAGDEGTSVLNAGDEGTSVLGGGMQPQATLTRRKTGERAAITKAVFTIGKERQKVDFCISDNSSVSRTHAKIMYSGGSYYIVDNRSTNFTYINGNKINPNQEIRLNSGDKIKLADEEFEFRL